MFCNTINWLYDSQRMVNMHFYRIVEWYLEYQLSVGINAKVAVWITKLVLEKHTIAITTLNPVKAYLYFCEQMLTKVLSALLSGHMLLENTIPTRSDTVCFYRFENWILKMEMKLSHPRVLIMKVSKLYHFFPIQLEQDYCYLTSRWLYTMWPFLLLSLLLITICWRW